MYVTRQVQWNNHQVSQIELIPLKSRPVVGDSSAYLIHYSKDTFQQRQTSELLMLFEQSLLFQMY